MKIQLQPQQNLQNLCFAIVKMLNIKWWINIVHKENANSKVNGKILVKLVTWKWEHIFAIDINKGSSKMKLMLLSLLVTVSSGLKCVCNDPNNCDQGLCETDGTCRAWVRRESHGGVKRGYQCIDKNKLFPPERPFACENSDAVRHRQGLICFI